MDDVCEVNDFRNSRCCVRHLFQHAAILCVFCCKHMGGDEFGYLLQIVRSVANFVRIATKFGLYVTYV